MFSPLLALSWAHYAFSIPLALVSIFLMLVILVQRGRGGGLTGALGGMGGQSAFGTKAGDLFTRVTIVVAAVWIILSMTALKVLNQRSATAGMNKQKTGVTAPATPGTPAASGTPTTPATTPATPPATTPPAESPAETPASSTPASEPAPSSPAPATPAPAPSTPAPADGAAEKPAANP
jgi:preprotein translocase subunit SecG